MFKLACQVGSWVAFRASIAADVLYLVNQRGFVSQPCYLSWMIAAAIDTIKESGVQLSGPLDWSIRCLVCRKKRLVGVDGSVEAGWNNIASPGPTRKWWSDESATVK
jgi:hypothetical protein